MLRPRSEAVREVKLRAACDRCHDLKNRCVRTGGGESRCDRCQRLDIDCVYRTSSSMGRPKRQRKEAARQSGQDNNHQRTMTDKILEMTVTGTDRHEVGEGEMEAEAIGGSGSMALADLPWDGTSIAMSPEGIWPAPPLTELDWGAETGHFSNNTTIHDPLLQFQEAHETPHTTPQDALHKNGGHCFKESGGGICSRSELTATLIGRLFQLQEQLYRLLQAGDGQFGFAYVQEGLEACKSLLDMLQTGSASKDSLLSAPVVSAGRQTSLGSNHSPNLILENDPSREGRPDIAPMSYIVVQQALTCYLYVLLLLERIVGVLTSCTGTGDVSVSVTQEPEPAAAIHLGIFSLASQPALNNEVVLLLILRLVRHLQEIIQALASRCNELDDDTDQTSTAAGSDPESSGKAKALPVSLAAVLHTMSDVVIKRERSLVGRLLSLTGAT